MGVGLQSLGLVVRTYAMSATHAAAPPMAMRSAGVYVPVLPLMTPQSEESRAMPPIQTPPRRTNQAAVMGASAVHRYRLPGVLP
jgi:hypothetical protein